MTIENMTTGLVPVKPEIAKRLADAVADDPNTYAETGGDLTLWPAEFATPPNSNMGERNMWHIPPALRPHYWRTADDDRRTLAGWPLEKPGMGRDVESWPPFKGLLTPLARATLRYGDQLVRDPEKERYLLHHLAMERAIASHKQAQHAAREAQLDATVRTCAACGIVNAADVQPRTIGAWTNNRLGNGPRLCLSCAKVASLQVAAAWEKRVNTLAAETTPNGRRSSAVAEWLAENNRKVLT